MAFHKSQKLLSTPLSKVDLFSEVLRCGKRKGYRLFHKAGTAGRSNIIHAGKSVHNQYISTVAS